MNVYVLVTVPERELLDSCTLCFDTLRVGFPTATIHVTVNTKKSYLGCGLDLMYKVNATLKSKFCFNEISDVHHAAWIKQSIYSSCCRPGPCVIIDADTIFWKSCEDWSFDASIAGYYVPLIWNDFAQCVSFERLHTSFLWIQNPKTLLAKLDSAYTNSQKESGEYCPVDPFMPRVQFIKGQPFFWDSTAALYNMVGGAHFGEQHLDCYEHLNSASFYKVMHERLENKQGFEFLHKHLVKTPDQLRGLWKLVHPYYAAKHQQALAFLSSAGQFGPDTLRILAPVLR